MYAYEFVNQFMYIHSTKCLVHVKGYIVCACWVLFFVEACCNGVLYVVLCFVSEAVVFVVAVLCSDA